MGRYIYQDIDVLLPNSHTEYTYQIEQFEIDKEYIAIPNSVELKFVGGDAEAFQRKYGLRDFVRCVAAGQVGKKQARLIQAMQGLGLPLVLVDPQQRRHAERCRVVAASDTHFIGEFNGDDLRNVFATVEVYALWCFYETPALSSLEAAIANNILVVSDCGCTKEYFQDQALYCDPNSMDSIRAAWENALCATPDVRLKERVLRDYT